MAEAATIAIATIINEKGLHARASAKFAALAAEYQADVRVTRENLTVSGDSLMGLLMLAAAKGSQIEIAATGSDAKSAVAALTALVADRFGEAS